MHNVNNALVVFFSKIRGRGTHVSTIVCYQCSSLNGKLIHTIDSVLLIRIVLRQGIPINLHIAVTSGIYVHLQGDAYSMIRFESLSP